MLLTGRQQICHPVVRSAQAGLWLLQLQGQYTVCHKTLGTTAAHCIHTRTHTPRADRNSQSILATRASYRWLTLSGWMLAHLTQLGRGRVLKSLSLKVTPGQTGNTVCNFDTALSCKTAAVTSSSLPASLL